MSILPTSMAATTLHWLRKAKTAVTPQQVASGTRLSESQSRAMLRLLAANGWAEETVVNTRISSYCITAKGAPLASRLREVAQ